MITAKFAGETARHPSLARRQAVSLHELVTSAGIADHYVRIEYFLPTHDTQTARGLGVPSMVVTLDGSGRKRELNVVGEHSERFLRALDAKVQRFSGNTARIELEKRSPGSATIK